MIKLTWETSLIWIKHLMSQATCRIKIRQQLPNKSTAAKKAATLAVKEPSLMEAGEAQEEWGTLPIVLETIVFIISRLCKSYRITSIPNKAAKSAWHATTRHRHPTSCQHLKEPTRTGVIKWDSKTPLHSSKRNSLSISCRYRTHWRI